MAYTGVGAENVSYTENLSGSGAGQASTGCRDPSGQARSRQGAGTPRGRPGLSRVQGPLRAGQASAGCTDPSGQARPRQGAGTTQGRPGLGRCRDPSGQASLGRVQGPLTLPPLLFMSCFFFCSTKFCINTEGLPFLLTLKPAASPPPSPSPPLPTQSCRIF
ncbi:hypothetical protein PoB_004717200 [Plakobranchus ocellatus]|uniref:Uncharacterized protein n=1 Tax=Plakobranchus ocellatus TaxID=259542 RepID=A0AAV4BMN7_9GAST|nr:hypothetical protein PoB_004717200 [Plakobranchus ocellatus]